MKNYKRILIVLLVLILAIALFACNDDRPENDNKPPVDDTDNEYTIDREPNTNQLTLYWQYPGEVQNCDIWMWWDGKVGSGYELHECKYGYKAVVNVPVGIDQVGFIVRRDCSNPGGSEWGTATKDYDSDRFAILTGEETFIYLKSGDANQYTSTDGGATLEIIKLFTMAGMVSLDQIQYNITPAYKIESLDDVKVYEGDRQIAVSAVSSLNNKVVTGTVTLAEELDITKKYEIEIGDFGKKVVVPTKIFDSAEFIENYTYDGDDLGAVIKSGSTQFKVWAPTASKVVLNLFNDGESGQAFANYEMAREDKGVFVYNATNAPHGTYYTYSVTTSVGTQEAVDPYAKSTGVNGNRGMVLNHSATNPQNFASDTYVDSIEKYTDAVLWEVHVRDFSNKIASSQYKGKYLAFTETGLTNSHGIPVGVDYVKNLGVTHVHLLPVYDYATVDEKTSTQFNWGYDPKNYNTPEGSYSTNPYDGSVRVKEFKQMVQGLHSNGLGVIMDVVYNHTYDANASLNKVVPYYYYRYTASGANSNGSGCGNETASDRLMYSKFMVDSVVYWATEYHVDGFRFDLMGLHDIATMQKIEQALHAINSKAIIYGEGWTGGSTPLSGSQQATQANISKVNASAGSAGAVAVFNDAIRDGLKGSVFAKEGKGYINGGATTESTNKVKFSIAGGESTTAGVSFRVKNAGIINYMSAHDNHTLWDKLAIANATSSVEERLAMNRLGAAIVMISKGTPFMQAGEEMLRTKNGNENSYNASDAINNINWEALSEDSNEYKMMLYYKQLIEMRKAYSIFRSNSGVVAVTCQTLANNAICAKFVSNTSSDRAIVVINPNASAMTYTLDGEWSLVGTDKIAGATPLQTGVTGEITVGARGIAILVK